MPKFAGYAEVIGWEYYDKVTLATNDVKATFFQNTVGSGSTPKVTYDTNMRLAGTLQSGESFDVGGIRVSAEPGDTVANVVALMKGYLELWIGNTCWWESPLFMMTAGGGLRSIMTALGTETDAGKAGFGDPDARNIWPFQRPIKITDKENFRVDMFWPTAPGNGLIIRCGLDGVLTRPIG